LHFTLTSTKTALARNIAGITGLNYVPIHVSGKALVASQSIINGLCDEY
jgi:hypothetical protein